MSRKNLKHRNYVRTDYCEICGVGTDYPKGEASPLFRLGNCGKHAAVPPLSEGQHTASTQPQPAPDEHGNIFVSEVGLHISNPDAEFLVKDESSTKCSASLAQQTNPLDGESASFPASSIDY